MIVEHKPKSGAGFHDTINLTLFVGYATGITILCYRKMRWRRHVQQHSRRYQLGF